MWRALTLIGLMLWPSSSEAATAFVQMVNNFAAAATTISKTFNSNVQAESTVIVAIGWYSNTVTISSVTICGSAATLYNNPTTQTDRMALAKLDNVAAGSCTVTVNLSGAADIIITAHEVSGTDRTDSNDGTIANTQVTPGTGTDAVTSTSITTTVDGDYIFGASMATALFSQINAGTGYTGRDIQATGWSTEDKIQTTAGSVAATFTNTNASESNITMVMALKPQRFSGCLLMQDGTSKYLVQNASGGYIEQNGGACNITPPASGAQWRTLTGVGL